MKTNPIRTVNLEKSKKLRICLSRIDLKDPKYNQMLHWHDCFELELVLAGNALHYLNDTVYRIRKGSMYFLSPSDLHSLRPDPESDSTKMEIINICAENTLLSELELGELQTPLTAELDNRQFIWFDQLSAQLLAEKRETGQYSEKIRESIFFAILLKFIQIGQHQTLEKIGANHLLQKFEDTQKGGWKDVRKAVSYIKYHFRDSSLSTQSIANAIHLTPNYFGNVFKKHMGVSCLEYLRNIRMDYAISLLSHTDLTVTEVAEKCGYSHMSYFITSFQKRYGISPQKYRDIYQTETPP